MADRRPLKETIKIPHVSLEDVKKATDLFKKESDNWLKIAYDKYQATDESFPNHVIRRDDMAEDLKKYYPTNSEGLKVDRSPLDRAINYVGGYDWGIGHSRTPEDIERALLGAKAYQLDQYNQATTAKRREDAVKDYLENVAGIKAAIQDNEAGIDRNRQDMVNDAVIFSGTQNYAEGGLAERTPIMLGENLHYAEGGKVSTDDTAIDDYAQLLEAYPNAKKFLASLGENISKVVPTREELENPEKRYEFALNAAANAPSGSGVLGTIKNMDKPIKASEALGQIEGRPLVITQADRTKVGGGYLGGPGFSSLQLTNPLYEAAKAAWGVKTPGVAKTILGGLKSGESPVYTTYIGTPNQHHSNQMVFDTLFNRFKKASQDEDLMTPDLLEKINNRLANYYKDKSTKENLFPEDVNILGRNFKKNYANTFDRRAAISEVIGGMGVGGKKGQIIDYDKIIRNTTDPHLLEAPTGALGNRLFTLTGDILENRHDLHPAFPTILQGEDLGLKFEPVPRELVMRDFIDQVRKEKGREPGYFDWTLGYPPSQLITEDLLTDLQKKGYAKGGQVSQLETLYNKYGIGE